MFGSSSSLPPLVNEGGELVCESVGPPSSSVPNYRPISIASVLSKVFERLVSIYGTQWCASNHPVCLSEKSGYM